MTVDAIIQARLSSSRLPRKMLMELNGIPLIEHVVRRLRQCGSINRVIVATTDDPSDTELVEYCKRAGVLYYQGSRDNVLQRTIEAGEEFGCNRIVRVCGDNPFLDVASLEAQLKIFVESDAIEYCTYVNSDSAPIILKPIGLFGEAVTLSALKKVRELAAQPKYFEHVTMYIYEHPEQFSVLNLPLGKNVNADLRFTIDYSEDVEWCSTILKMLDVISLDTLLGLMASRPDLMENNLKYSYAHQKKY